MRDEASKEWVQQKPDGVIKIPCELCGNTKSEDKYIIYNRLNGNTLRVGSSCIYKFPKLDKKYMGVSISTISKLLKLIQKSLKNS